MYKLIDKQNAGTFSKLTFNDKEEIRQQLASYHSIDWTMEKDINTMSLDDLLDYGDWEIESMNNKDIVIHMLSTLYDILDDEQKAECDEIIKFVMKNL